jgi:MFS family permease
VSDSRAIAAIVAAQVLVQIGAFTLPALLPHYLDAWSLSATEAGALIGAFFAAYVVAVPVLVALTDRVPTRNVYLVGAAATAISHLGFAFVADGFWSGLVLRAIGGIGWAGCYMPGLKAIADRVEGAAQSRAVSWHAAGVGSAGAASFLVAGLLDLIGGTALAFAFGGVAALVAFGIGAVVMPRHAPRSGVAPSALLDFRPVLRNRAAMAWIAGYTAHTWELAALRAWGVTFVAAAITVHGAPGWMPGPTAIFAAASFLGIVVSVTGNESAQRYGRLRLVAGAMGAGALFSALSGFALLGPAPLAALCVLAWNAAIYLDSAALTAGTVQAAEKERRGATMGLHSMCGYTGGFIGPVGVGIALDAAGAETVLGWVLGFGHLVPVTLLGLWAVRRLGRV